jgi:signal transduction histidine kinase
LLNISKYEKPTQAEFKIIPIGELIKSILEKNKNLAQIKNIKIESKIESEASVLGDKTELKRVFFNILDNAIKYTKEGGIISVSDRIASNKYIVTVSDNGMGISNDILGKIFDPFFRGDASRSTEGAGLGLTLSKKIIENHKGTIAIRSGVGKGTNVTITLPISS